MHRVIFHAHDDRVEIEVEGGANLLQAALDAGIDLDFFCASGQCGSCEVTVRCGGDRLSPTTPAERELISQARRRKGRRLACQVRVCGDVDVS